MIISKLIAVAIPIGKFDPPSTVLKADDYSSALKATTKLEGVISEVLGLVTIVGGIALLLYFVLGALNWISSAGDAGKIEKARSQMVQSVSGMVLLVAAYGLIGLIGNFLGLKLLSPGAAILNIVQPTSGP